MSDTELNIDNLISRLLEGINFLSFCIIIISILLIHVY